MNVSRNVPYLGVGLERVGKALFCGTATGALLTGMSFALLSVSVWEGVGDVFTYVFMATLVALIPWFIGVLVIGLPMWVFGYKRGWTSARDMTGLAFFPPFILMIAIAANSAISGRLGSLIEGFWAFSTAVLFGAIGAVVGLVAHRVAYHS